MTVQKTWSSMQFLAKVVDVPVVWTTGAWLCQSRLLWRVRSCTPDEPLGRFFRALHTGAVPGVVSTGTRSP